MDIKAQIREEAENYVEECFNVGVSTSRKDNCIKAFIAGAEWLHTEIVQPLQSQLSLSEQRVKELEALIAVNEEKENDPYWYWPQCDVDGCKGVSCNNGRYWRETGYWCLCSEHAKMGREGKPQPQMKQASIDKEKTRDEKGYLPSTENNL